jgi:hypothetical protein
MAVFMDSSKCVNVVGNIDDADYTVVVAKNRKTLVKAIKHVIRAQGLDVEQFDGRDGRFFLKIQMDCCCGSVSFATEDDVPKTSVKCPCGNPHHWLLRYEE